MSASASRTFLSSVEALLVEQGLGKTRTNILAKQLKNHGGEVVKTLSSTTTHILVGNSSRLVQVLRVLKIDSIDKDTTVLRADWLSACLTKKQLVPEEEYQLYPDEIIATAKSSPHLVLSSTERNPTVWRPDGQSVTSGNESRYHCVEDTAPSLLSSKAGMFSVTNKCWTSASTSGKLKAITKQDGDSGSDYIESEEEAVGEMCDAEDAPPVKRKKWICELSSSTSQTWVNHNQHITGKLEELLIVYQNNGEKWRAMSTIKAIQALKKHPSEITTLEEVKSVPFVGKRLADKICEIVSCGNLRRLDCVDKEKEVVVDMLKNVYGVGQVTAQKFYAQGYRSLEDLERARVLNKVQQIGLRHYHDFLERMQREEVAEIEAKVRVLAHSIDKGLEVVTCGSYRRGKPTCGDVDILITHVDGRSYRGVLGALLEKGHEDGFLTDDLSVSHDTNGSGKYLGVCKLEGEGRKFRRLDIMVVPYCEFPLALVHFTGSGHMNRSMRSKADKMGMSLSEHALCTGVIRRNGEKIFEGTPLLVTCEEDIFTYLGLDYLEPHNRDWD